MWCTKTFWNNHRSGKTKRSHLLWMCTLLVLSCGRFVQGKPSGINQSQRHSKEYDLRSVFSYKKDVVEKKKRPDITQVKHKQLAIIIQDCWDQDPDNRPSFEGLISHNTLQIARADIFLSDFPDAHKLWLDNWNSYFVRHLLLEWAYLLRFLSTIFATR